MWTPQTADDVRQAIDVLTENSQLDFKRDLSGKKPDLAKDVAAMSLEGGVIVVGVDEDDSGTAAKLTPFELAGAPEMVQQLIDSNVRPPIGIGLQAIPEHDGADKGFLVIRVPPSLAAPHMWNDRYPARSNATTRYLSELEVERLYERRASVLRQEAAGRGLDDFAWPPGAIPAGIEGIGRLRVHVQPVGAAPHPATPWLRKPLEQATAEATATLGNLVHGHHSALASDWLGRWKPLGSAGVCAGDASDDFATLRDHDLAAAVFRRQRGDFSFLTTRSLLMDGGEWTCAYEHLWALELMADLAIAGAFYRAVPAASMLAVAIALENLNGSVSYRVSQGRARVPEMVTVADFAYQADAMFAARDLAADPGPAVRELLDPLFASFLDDGYDVVARLSQ